MSLIKKPQQAPEKKQFRTRIDKKVFNEMNEYCQWLEVSADYFIEQACALILRKDKDWQAYKRAKNS